nr:zinc finger protein 2 homolog isoform X1 [Aedes albopictus]XP_029708943.1 zinc finger protein 2 homolog isoform X1 [Aedes albopictus]
MAFTNIKTEPLDFDDKPHICRLCLSEESLENVFEAEGIQQWISDFLSIMITTEDRMSQSICAICRIRLADFHDFRERCHKVQSLLIAEIPERRQDSDLANPLPPSTPSIQCQVCHKVFTTKRQRKDHMRNHNSEHICKRCGQCFVKRRDLEKHRKTHKIETREKQENLKSNERELTVVQVRQTNTEPLEEVHYLGAAPHNTTDGNEQQFGVEDIIVVEEVKLEVHGDDGGVPCELDETSALSEIDKNQLLNQSSITTEEIIIATSVQNQKDVQKNVQQKDIVDSGENSSMTEEADANHGNSTTSTSNHIQESDGAKQFQCDVCNKVFSVKKKLLDHKRQTHGPKNFSCPICDKAFRLQYLMENHKLTHQPKTRPFECDECHCTFTGSFSLQKHKKYKHGPKKYKCDICGLQFSSRSALQFHMQRHTRNSDKKEELLQKETIVDGKVTNNETVEASDPNSAEIAQPKNKDDDGSTVCSMCDKVFQNLQGYLMHFKDAHKKKRTCVLCNVIFVSNQRFVNHLLTEHMKEDAEQKEGDVSGNLWNIVQSAEDRKKIDKQALSKRNLDSEPISAAECEQCRKRFINMKCLDSHIRNVHHPKRYSCSTCGKGFLAKRPLLRHQETHKNDNISLECEKCNKVFPTWRKKSQHMRHHVPMRHRCKYCQERFAKRLQLLKHYDTHHAKGDTIQAGSQEATPTSLPDNELEGETKRLSPENLIEDNRKLTESDECQETIKKKPKRQKIRHRKNAGFKEDSQSHESLKQIVSNEEQDAPEDPVLLFEAEQFKIEQQ